MERKCPIFETEKLLVTLGNETYWNWLKDHNHDPWVIVERCCDVCGCYKEYCSEFGHILTYNSKEYNKECIKQATKLVNYYYRDNKETKTEYEYWDNVCLYFYMELNRTDIIKNVNLKGSILSNNNVQNFKSTNNTPSLFILPLTIDLTHYCK